MGEVRRGGGLVEAKPAFIRTPDIVEEREERSLVFSVFSSGE